MIVFYVSVKNNFVRNVEFTSKIFQYLLLIATPDNI